MKKADFEVEIKNITNQIIKNTKKKYLDRVREVALMLDSKFPTDIFVLTPQELEVAITQNRFLLLMKFCQKVRLSMKKLKYQADIRNWLLRAEALAGRERGFRLGSLNTINLIVTEANAY